MKIIFLALATLFLINYGHPAALAQSNETHPFVKLSVLQSGKVFIDGKESFIAQVEQRLKTLKSQDGEVWYHREAGNLEPPPEATQVIKLVIDNELPITLSSKPDFSDYVDENGQLHPR